MKILHQILLWITQKIAKQQDHNQDEKERRIPGIFLCEETDFQPLVDVNS